MPANLRYSGKKQALWEEIAAKVLLLKPLLWTQVRQKWSNFVNSHTKFAAQQRLTKGQSAADLLIDSRAVLEGKAFLTQKPSNQYRFQRVQFASGESAILLRFDCLYFISIFISLHFRYRVRRALMSEKRLPPIKT